MVGGSLKVYIWNCNIISNSRKIIWALINHGFNKKSGTVEYCIADFLGGGGAKWGLDKFQN